PLRRPRRSPMKGLMPRLASLLVPALLLACSGPAQAPPGPAPTPIAPAAPPAAAPAAPVAVGTVQLTVTAAPDRVLPAIAWYPARSAGEAAPPILGRKLPVVLMSHGWNGRKEHAAFLAERLVSAGYLVAAVDHINDGAAMALQRPLDLARLLDRLSDRAAEPAFL